MVLFNGNRIFLCVGAGGESLSTVRGMEGEDAKEDVRHQSRHMNVMQADHF